MITYQTKTFEKPNIVYLKSLITEQKIKFKQLKKSSNGSLYSDTKKDVKITKGEHAFKGYANTYNVEILSFFNPNYNLKI